MAATTVYVEDSGSDDGQSMSGSEERVGHYAQWFKDLRQSTAGGQGGVDAGEGSDDSDLGPTQARRRSQTKKKIVSSSESESESEDGGGGGGGRPRANKPHAFKLSDGSDDGAGPACSRGGDHAAGETPHGGSKASKRLPLSLSRGRAGGRRGGLGAQQAQARPHPTPAPSLAPARNAAATTNNRTFPNPPRAAPAASPSVAAAADRATASSPQSPPFVISSSSDDENAGPAATRTSPTINRKRRRVSQTVPKPRLSRQTVRAAGSGDELASSASATNSNPTPVDVQKMRSPYPKLGVRKGTGVPRTGTGTGAGARRDGPRAASAAHKKASSDTSSAKPVCVAKQAADYFQRRRTHGIMREHGAVVSDPNEVASSDAEFQVSSRPRAGVDSAKKTPWTLSLARTDSQRSPFGRKGKRSSIFSEDEDDTDLDGFLVNDDEESASGAGPERGSRKKRGRTSSAKRRRRRDSFLSPFGLNDPTLAMHVLAAQGVKTRAELVQLDAGDFLELEGALKTAGVVLGDRSKIKNLARQQARTQPGPGSAARVRIQSTPSLSGDSSESGPGGGSQPRAATRRRVSVPISDSSTGGDDDEGLSARNAAAGSVASANFKPARFRRSLHGSAGSNASSGSSDDGDSDSNDDDSGDGVVNEFSPVAANWATNLSLADAHDRLVHLFLSACLDVESFECFAEDNTFKYARIKVRTALANRKDFCVASASWSPDFKDRIERYPVLQVTSSVKRKGACEACQRKNDQGSAHATLSGRPYEPETFAASEESHRTSKEYRLGPTCAQRVKIYHGLQHYEMGLFKKCKTKLDHTKEASSSSSDNENVRDIMDDTRWLSRMFRSFESMLHEVDAKYRRGN